MVLAQIERSAIEAALVEFDALGRQAFLTKHGFGFATTYLLRHRGRFYDPKAIVGVANQGTADGRPLKPNEFDATSAIARLETLGYEIVPFSGLWWVNQGATYKAERDGGYLWAPQQNKSGRSVAHHRDVDNLAVGQRIIHYANNSIRAISTVAEAPYAAPRPVDFDTDAWADMGYLCPVDYSELTVPIRRDDIPDRGPDVGPFSKDGNVRQVYLVPIQNPHVCTMLQFLNERIPDLFDSPITHPHASTANGPIQVPERLVEQLQNGRCVLVIGASAARAAGTPTWREVIADLAPAALGGPGYQPEQIQAMNGAEIAVLAELLTAELGPKRVSAAIRDRLRRQPGRQAPAWVRVLAELPFASVISLNWDDSFERLLESRNPEVLLPGRALPDHLDSDLAALRVLKPLGTMGNVPSLLLSLSDYNRRYGASSDFGRLLSATLAANTVLFVGIDANTINELLISAGVESGKDEHPDFAVLDDNSGLEARLMRSRHNVWTLAASSSERFAPALRARVNAQPRRHQPRVDHLVHEMRLSNIGPFRRLRVRFTDDWTVLLGDNGAGKSSILRALAFALCGDSVLPGEADRLLMTDRKSGFIEVTVGGTKYMTSLERERHGVRVIASVPTPVETGDMLAIGFPAFRGVSRKAPSGPREDRVLGVGHPSDLEALRTGSVDDRFDDLQQWLINLAVVHGANDIFGNADRAGERLDSVFALWERLMPGMRLRYAGLNSARWEVLAHLDGTTVPLHTFSQGALSTISWIGTLVRRLVDRYGKRIDELANMPALIIVDELDAHLHPEWQRLIVPRLREALPNLQVIATTHSPLIVGSLEAGEVLTLHRTPAGDGRVEESEQFRGWRADQILTSPAFGLDTSRDAETERDLDEYQAALGERPVDPALLERVARLPRSGETELERQAAELIDAGLQEQLSGLPDDRRAALVRQAAEYLRRLRGGEN
jgi:hypothetical protein